MVDAAALMLSARLPEEVFAFFRVYPIFFATSFQWGSFNHVGQYPSATLFLTGNLKNCVTRWLRYFFYRDVQDLTGARIYTLTIANYLLGGSLGLCRREYPRRSRSLLGFCAAGCGSAGALAGALRPAGSRRTL